MYYICMAEPKALFLLLFSQKLYACVCVQRASIYFVRVYLLKLLLLLPSFARMVCAIQFCV